MPESAMLVLVLFNVTSSFRANLPIFSAQSVLVCLKQQSFPLFDPAYSSRDAPGTLTAAPMLACMVEVMADATCVSDAFTSKASARLPPGPPSPALLEMLAVPAAVVALGGLCRAGLSFHHYSTAVARVVQALGLRMLPREAVAICLSGRGISVSAAAAAHSVVMCALLSDSWAR